MTKQTGHVVGFAVNLVLTVFEFWTFVILRETHVINWSWWWLAALQIGSYVSVYVHEKKAGLV